MIGIFAPRRWVLSLGLLVSVSVVAFESLAVATILPTAAIELDGRAWYGWAFTAFLVGSLVGAVEAGELADRRGSALPAWIGFALFGTGLLVAGLAPAWAVLLFGRLLQGFGGGMFLSLAYAAVARGYAMALQAPDAGAPVERVGDPRLRWPAYRRSGRLVGGILARRLLDRGEHLRILVRPTSEYASLIAAGAEPFLGDLKHASTLAAACAGADVVVTTATSGSRGGLDTPDRVDLRGNRDLIDAARTAGVTQFVFASTIAAEDSPIPLLRAKAVTEAHLR